MSDTEGTRPEHNDPESPATPQQPAAAPASPTASGAGTPAAPAAPATPPSHGVPAQPPYPAAPRPPYAGTYGGQVPPTPKLPAAGAFGPAANAYTAPTLPLAGSAPAAAKKRSGAGRVAGLIVAAALVGGAAGLGGAYAGVSLWGDTTQPTASGGSVITVNNTDSVNNTTAVAAKVVPSVVTIEASSGNSGGTGSGVILSEDGYVLTNTHVVTLDGQTSDPTITVSTSDGHIYQASVVGTDPTYDLAVIKLEDASGLTPVTWGDSTKLNVGDETIAIGAPLGLSNTVTEGIVSALNRSIEISSSAAPDSSDDSGDSGDQNGENGQQGPFYFDFGQGQEQQTQTKETIKIAVIQTDAAINPGNSGGALVDSDGKLVGINVAIASAGQSTSSGQSGSIGVGFSIPSSVAERVAQEIIDNGSATHGLLGATVQPAGETEGVDITGAYISDVTSGGAAAAAGLQKGDIVTKFNGAPITDAIDLTAQVRAVAAGDTVSLTYVRDGQDHTAQVTLGAMK